MTEAAKNPELEVKAAADALKAATDEVKRFAEQVQTEMKNLGDATRETKANADKALTEMNEAKAALKDAEARLADVEQKLARRAGAAPQDERKSLGQAVIDNAEVKTRVLDEGQNANSNVRVKIETKTILSATATWGSTASVATSLVVPERLPIVPLPLRPLRVRSLLAQGNTASNAIEYPVQTGFTNNAAVVAENTTKPYSDMTFDLRNAPVRTIAHMFKASRQILDDAPALQSFIDAQGRYGIEFAEEAELLNGDGTGQHLYGIIPQAAAYSGAFTVTGETAIDRLRLAVLQGTLALYPMDGFVLHPTDWAKIEVTKDGMGRYLIGDPVGNVAPRLWGLPVVATLAMTAGNFLTGAFAVGAQIFDRMSIEVLISTENNVDFEKNLISIRIEERLALAVYRPAAFITGALP